MKFINQLRTLVAASVIIVVTSSLLFVFVNGQFATASNTDTTADSSITGIAAGSGMNFHIWPTGEAQGLIEGDSPILSMDRENTIMGYQYTHNAYLPSDPTGQISGKRIYSPVTVLIQHDKSAPLLWKAFVELENFVTVEMRFYRPDPVGDGTTQWYFTVLLENALISSIRDFQPNNQNVETYMTLTKEVSFIFETITWTWEDGGITFTDTFERPEY